MAQQSGRAGKKVLKLITMLCLMVITAIAVKGFLQKRDLIIRENKAVNCWNSDDVAGALTAYLALYPDLQGADKERVSKAIAACYCAQAQEPSLSFAGQLDLYRKAYSYDQASVTDPRIVAMIQRKP